MQKNLVADPDPGSGAFLILTRDPGWKKPDPGSAINILDPQHCIFLHDTRYVGWIMDSNTLMLDVFSCVLGPCAAGEAWSLRTQISHGKAFFLLFLPFNHVVSRYRIHDNICAVDCFWNYWVLSTVPVLLDKEFLQRGLIWLNLTLNTKMQYGY